ncbi:hypothetical protein [Nocardiopsis sp. NPDC058789]|uniref:hypothetical protein n=1 Tax=Nocardiopsis TaxID=2013 RepID=UPI00366C60EC
MDMLPTPWPVGLAVGVVLDIALVSAVAIAWINPGSARGAKKFGWFVASIAAVLVGWHAFEMLPVLAVLGIVPLVAKGLWHIALNTRLARAAAEEAEKEAALKEAAEKLDREAELSTDPSHEQKRLVAQKRRDAAHERELAEAEVDFDNARAERDHKLKLAAIRRAAQEAREMEREDAETIKQRVALVREIEAGRGLAIGSGGDARNPAVASPSASLMGFGSVMTADLGTSRGRPGSVPSGIDPELRELMTYIASAGEKASVRGAAAELNVTPPTIRRWREKAEGQGLDMSALRRRSK